MFNGVYTAIVTPFSNDRIDYDSYHNLLERQIKAGVSGVVPCGTTGECPRNLDPSSVHGQGDYDLCWATHAEANALLRCSWEEMVGSTIYITGAPCAGCSKLINSAGISRIVNL
jgi:deoxycytidylate deaminase